ERSSASALATGMSIGCGLIGATSGACSAAMSSGSSRCTGPGAFLLRQPKRFAHDRRYRRRADDLTGHFGQRRHGRDDVDDLEAALLAAEDALLTCDHDHRHGAEQCIGRAGREIERAWAERREANSRLTGEPSVRGGHESRRLLMACYDEPDPRAAQ